MSKLVLFGAGDFARLVRHYFERDSPHQVVAYTVDRAYWQAETFDGLPVVEFERVAEHYPPSEFQMFVAVGYNRMNRVRAEKYAAGKALGYELASYISSRCTYLSDNPIGDNCFILENCTLQPFTRIGNNVVMWSGCQISHDAVVGDHCFLAPHVTVAGGVRIRAYSFIGANATLRNNITIAPATLVGAGAVITEDTVERGVYAPARAVRLSKTSDEIEV